MLLEYLAQGFCGFSLFLPNRGRICVLPEGLDHEKNHIDGHDQKNEEQKRHQNGNEAEFHGEILLSFGSILAASCRLRHQLLRNYRDFGFFFAFGAGSSGYIV